MEKIETNRLLLHPFAQSDYDDLYELLAQRREELFEGYPGITYENGREHLAYRVGSEEFYAIEEKISGKVIGNVYCGCRDFAGRELGYIVNKNYQRRGYAAEAVRAVLEAAFAAGTHRVYAECDPRNICSWACWSTLALPGRRCCGRISFSAGMRQDAPSGRIPMFMAC